MRTSMLGRLDALLLSALLLGTATLTASAQTPTPTPVAEDFAWQWPLDIPAGTEVVQFTVDPTMYARLARSDLRDLVAFNAAGESLAMGPAASLWSPAREVDTAIPMTQPLPLFRVPSAPALAADGLQLHVERDANGRLRQLHAEIGEGPVGATAHDWLLDLSDLRAPVQGLSFTLDPGTVGSLNARIEIAGSRDLDRWQSVGPPQALISLQQGEFQLQRLHARFAPVQWPYLRLRRIDRDASVNLASVSAELQPSRIVADARLSLDVTAHAATNLAGAFEYTLAGPYPVERIGVLLADRNALATVIVESRADPQQAWRTRASGTAFRLAGEGEDIAADPFELPIVRDRHWRLRSEPPLARAPVLRVGYRAESFVVLAQGDGPYRLAAGSATARRPDYPLPAVVARLRAQHGTEWQPMAVSLGVGQPLSGEAALVAPATPIAWRQWLLWGVLVGAAGLIIALAVRLLREKRSD